MTPYLVRAANVANALHTPMDGFEPPNDVDRVLLMRQRARAGTPDADGRQLGDAGFLLN